MCVCALLFLGGARGGGGTVREVGGREGLQDCVGVDAGEGE